MDIAMRLSASNTLILKLFLVSLVAILVPSNTLALLKPDTLYADQGKTIYDVRVEKYVNNYNAFIPHYTKIQYAGCIGMMSIGLGWDYGKNRRWETDFLMGFVPHFESNRAKLTFTLRECFMPWEINLRQSIVSFHPFRVSLGVNSIVGHEFWNKNPSRYPNGYYFFSTKFHIVGTLGQQWTVNISEPKRRAWRAIGFYYDLCTSDPYVLSGFGNRAIGFKDIFSLSLGLKLLII